MHCQLLGISFQGLQKVPQKVGTENCLRWSTGKICKNVSSWPTGLFGSFLSGWLFSSHYFYPTHSSMSALPPSLPHSWNFFNHWQPLHFLERQLALNLHPHILQLGRYIYLKMELLFFQLLVQVHRIRFHAVGQYLYNTKSIVVLKQPSCNVFFIEKKNLWKLFWLWKLVKRHPQVKREKNQCMMLFT